MIEKMRAFFRKRRHKKAEQYRRLYKRDIALSHDFFAGLKTKEESLKWRDFAYNEIDKMSDDEMLKNFWWL